MSDGRSERVTTAADNPEMLEEAKMADEDVPFEVALAAGDTTTVFDTLVSPDE
ncbi:hypothetical protein OsI_01997 [Oryza sativa Indica Group]|uniref:Uncharacterized protein n=1 Tax=Oryza sativa subsp. indica TaxID=39946 RepID=A2WQ67_ORYSI|nr:hypothetical protein OsI_01997 [Oryza sativa Indica Group]